MEPTLIGFIVKSIAVAIIICIALYFGTGLVLRAIRDFKNGSKEERNAKKRVE